MTERARESVPARPLYRLVGIGKCYDLPGAAPVRALAGVSLVLERGEFLAIVGSSGSGKSTLMNLLGLLDRPSEGSLLVDGEDATALSAAEEARIRNRRFGFVFQAFRLLPRASAVENVELPLLYSDRGSIAGLAQKALESVGLAARLRHRPSQLSGGQQQRVAIARALVNDPDVLLADEPTGNLDERSALEIVALFQRLNRAGRTVVLVTHDSRLALHARRIARLEGGRIAADERVAEPLDAAVELAERCPDGEAEGAGRGWGAAARAEAGR
jgi:putative ABC transport system ATP-binding protein